MKKLLLVAFAALLAGSAGHSQVNPGALQWQPAADMLPPGARVAMLAGNPAKAGTFVFRLRFPPGYAIAPHRHPTAEYVTVIAGSLYLGHGSTMRRPRRPNLVAGGFIMTPANMNHYAYTRTGATVQVSGEGPFTITYVNPKDDPRKK